MTCRIQKESVEQGCNLDLCRMHGTDALGLKDKGVEHMVGSDSPVLKEVNGHSVCSCSCYTGVLFKLLRQCSKSLSSIPRHCMKQRALVLITA